MVYWLANLCLQDKYTEKEKWKHMKLKTKQQHNLGLRTRYNEVFSVSLQCHFKIPWNKISQIISEPTYLDTNEWVQATRRANCPHPTLCCSSSSPRWCPPRKRTREGDLQCKSCFVQKLIVKNGVVNMVPQLWGSLSKSIQKKHEVSLWKAYGIANIT